MTLHIGEIREINRYPVKSFAGESLESCKVEAYGLYGDRFCAFYDEEKEGWGSYITARAIPDLLRYKARLYNGAVSVRAPDGRLFGWDEPLRAEIQKFAKYQVSMTSYQAENVAIPGLMAVDQGSVLIVTDSSVRKLESLWGKALDRRRFRANLVVTVKADYDGEDSWIGKRLCIGDTQLLVDSYCERCSMITIDPDTLERDPSLLKRVYEELDGNFGLYASVHKTGQIKVGDKVFLEDFN